jgi:uncharacterized membrane protein (UPF0136 family)
VVDVRPDRSLAGLAVGTLAGLREPLLAEELDGGLQIALGRLEASLQSMTPAPVRSRRSFTICAVAAIR